MRIKIIIPFLIGIIPMVANSAIPYRTEQLKPTHSEDANIRGNDSEAFARENRFYVGGAYNFSMGQDSDDDIMKLKGGNKSSFEVVAGIRLYDTFRIEANYYKFQASWDDISLSGDTVFVNALFDARIDSMYRIFRKQMLVPYVGLGAGLSFNSAKGATIDNKMSPVAAGLVGISIEFNNIFALDVGYRYMYMFSPKFDIVEDLNPVSHQFRLGARINF